MEAIINYLKEKKSPNLDKAMKAIECFDPYNRKPEMYGISAAFYGQDCIIEVIELLNVIHKNKLIHQDDPESDLDVKVNSIVVANSEHYYHTMVTTHIGDARATDMVNESMINVGQLVRDYYGLDNVFSVGFGTYHGTVIASKKWAGKFEVIPVPYGAEGSLEEAFHLSNPFNQFLIFTEDNKKSFEKEIDIVQ